MTKLFQIVMGLGTTWLIVFLAWVIGLFLFMLFLKGGVFGLGLTVIAALALTVWTTRKIKI